MISDYLVFDIDNKYNNNNSIDLYNNNNSIFNNNNNSTINQINQVNGQSKRKGTYRKSNNNFNKLNQVKKEIIEDSIAISNTYWYIKAWIIINNNKSRLINLMADTGATICAINTKSQTIYSNKIQTLKRTRDVFTAGKKTLKIDKYIDLSFIHPKTHDLITTIHFILLTIYNIVFSIPLFIT